MLSPPNSPGPQEQPKGILPAIERWLESDKRLGFVTVSITIHGFLARFELFVAFLVAANFFTMAAESLGRLLLRRSYKNGCKRSVLSSA